MMSLTKGEANIMTKGGKDIEMDAKR